MKQLAPYWYIQCKNRFDRIIKYKKMPMRKGERGEEIAEDLFSFIQSTGCRMYLVTEGRFFRILGRTS